MTDYKKYSLEQLENFLYDAMGAAEATPQEIYDVIKGVVEDNYYTYKKQASDAYELLSLLNGNGEGHSTSVISRGNKVHQAVDDCMPPWGHSDMEALIYTDKEMDAMCDNAAKQDKVIRWQLPVEEIENGDTGEQEYFITFPEDLLEAANLSPGEEVEWVDRNDGSFLLRKITKPLGMDEC